MIPVEGAFTKPSRACRGTVAVWELSSPPELFTLLPTHPEIAETWGQSLVSVPHPGNKDTVTAAPWTGPVFVRLIYLSPAWVLPQPCMVSHFLSLG